MPDRGKGRGEYQKLIVIKSGFMDTCMRFPGFRDMGDEGIWTLRVCEGGSLARCLSCACTLAHRLHPDRSINYQCVMIWAPLLLV